MLEVDISHSVPGFSLEAGFTHEGRGVTALYGRSGAGKTTLILAVAGLLRGARGRIALNGNVLLDSAAGVNLPARRRRVGLVFQDGRLFPHLSVRGNLLYGARRAPGGAGAASLDHVVDLLGIGALLDRRPLGLSGGERQRVALGRALLSAPHLLLLDEPLAALDAERKAEILPYLERLRDEANIPILYVSHSAEEITRLADRVVALKDGRVIADGPAERVFVELGLNEPGEEASAIVAATVLGTAEDRLTDLSIGDPARGDSALLAVPALSAPSGARVHLRIRARDVMIALDRPERISANNILPVRIVEAAEHGEAVLFLLDCAGQTLSALLTRRAAKRLGLAPGMAAYAVVKTVTLAR